MGEAKRRAGSGGGPALFSDADMGWARMWTGLAFPSPMQVRDALKARKAQERRLLSLLPRIPEGALDTDMATVCAGLEGDMAATAIGNAVSAWAETTDLESFNELVKSGGCADEGGPGDELPEALSILAMGMDGDSLEITVGRGLQEITVFEHEALRRAVMSFEDEDDVALAAVAVSSIWLMRTGMESVRDALSDGRRNLGDLPAALSGMRTALEVMEKAAAELLQPPEEREAPAA